GNQAEIENWLNNNGGAAASDACSNVTWTNHFTGISGDCSATATVTFTATDACGNTATTTATIQINDTTAPVAPTAPEDVTVSCIEDVPAMITLTAQDNCDGEITVTGTDISNKINNENCTNNQIITRTWTFVDACGNSSSATQTINVTDNIAPVFDQLP